MKTPKLTKLAKQEIEAYKLLANPNYCIHFQRYADAYAQRPPHGVPDRNMVRALRLMPWENIAEDWARLHACEAFLKARH
jgi:hypothetical protein